MKLHKLFLSYRLSSAERKIYTTIVNCLFDSWPDDQQLPTEN